MSKSSTPIGSRSSKGHPCPVCGSGSKGCSITADGLHLCRGGTDPGPGWSRISKAEDSAGFSHFRRSDDEYQAATDWSGRVAGFVEQFKPGRWAPLAKAIGLPIEAFQHLGGIGFSAEEKCWTFPEFDSAGKVCGINRRYLDGSKKAVQGSTRGITIPWAFGDRTGPVLLPEGATDVLALSLVGICSLGRPSNMGGVEQIAVYLGNLNIPLDRPIVMMAENDEKETGQWPGKEGAQKSAVKLADLMQRPIFIMYPPEGVKDCRAWVLDLWAGLGESGDWLDVGGQILAAVESAAVPINPAPSLLAASTKPEEADLDISASNWPDPLEGAALHGLAGDVVRAIDPHTEADPAAILFQFLVGFGNMVGRKSFYRVEASRHYSNLFVVLVGQSSRARKGTSWQRAYKVLERGGDAEWAKNRVVSGLSSGEGLIWEVRDPVMRRQPTREGGKVTGHESVEVDGGVEDKRSLVIEEEFASVLQVGKREGSILGSVIRSAWDTGNLGSLTKSSPARARGAHISIISHITRTELLETISTTQAHNGFLNRFLWASVRRSKLLPYGGRDTDLTGLSERLEGAWRFGSEHERELAMTAPARTIWGEQYERLTADRPGLFGAVTSRSEAQTLRLALVFALLDRSDTIGVPHLNAALAVERFVEASARHIFGDVTGNTVADEIRALLKANPKGVGQLDIINHFGRNKAKADLEHALTMLVTAGMAKCEKVQTDGRPRTMWYIRTPYEQNEVNEVSPLIR